MLYCSRGPPALKRPSCIHAGRVFRHETIRNFISNPVKRPKAILKAVISDKQAEQQAAQQATCKQLMEASGTSTILEMRPSAHQNGLFTSAAVQKGDVLMSVPREICLIIDYNKGLSVPSSGSWPRLKDGLMAQDPLTWDLLLSLALIDVLSGEGGEFWQTYCQAIFPAPEALTLPMCWSQQRLEQLQHGAIMDAALQQQERLANMFPDLMSPIADDTPSWFQWAFACVRSRAYKLSEDVFAVVPFWDLANHGVQPNSDFRSDPSGKGPLQLIAVKDIPANTEVLISYTGPEGYTNQRLMAQYGFVIPHGNPADRVSFAPSTVDRSAGLSLERIQELMGDQIFCEIISAENAYGYSALKSLPITDENSSNEGNKHSMESSVGHANILLSQCRSLIQGCPTSLVDDEVLLNNYRAGTNEGPKDERDIAALEYRVERKRLLKACCGILELYIPSH